MNRFFLNKAQFSGDIVTFTPEIAHQIVHVLRLGGGDLVEALDNQGFVYRVTLNADAQEHHLTGRILDTEPVTSEPSIQVSLCFGLSNRDKVEWILQKGTEIGVSAFYPFVSARTLVQSTSLTENKLARWERIIREAAEQSRRGRLPILNPPVDFRKCISLATKKHGLCLIAWEEAAPANAAISHIIDTFKGDRIALFVGPEGGFSEDEISQAREMGCQVVSMGERILRMETAAIILPALVLHDLGEL